MNDGFDLSPELLEAIAPNVNPEDAQIKFDDMGTLHVLERDKEGSLKNDYALKHIEEALRWMNKRVEDRIERNVLGTNTK